MGDLFSAWGFCYAIADKGDLGAKRFYLKDDLSSLDVLNLSLGTAFKLFRLARLAQNDTFAI